jgi:hypothetical protein
MEKEIIHGVKTGYVGALATPWVSPPLLRERKKKKKTLDDCDNLDWLKTYQETTWDELALRRERM